MPLCCTALWPGFMELQPACEAVSKQQRVIYCVGWKAGLTGACTAAPPAVHDEICGHLNELGLPTTAKGNAGQGTTACPYLCFAAMLTVPACLAVVGLACWAISRLFCAEFVLLLLLLLQVVQTGVA